MKGKISAGVFKVMAVVSALAIGGGYVAWRQMEAEKANKSEQVEQAKEEVEEKPLMLSGSKSYTGGTLLKEGDFIEQIPGLPEGTEEVTDVVPLLPGSKSISMPLFTKDQIKQLKPEDKGAKEVEFLPEDLLPSSKIGILRLDKTTEKKGPALLPGSKSNAIFIPEKAKPEASE